MGKGARNKQLHEEELLNAPEVKDNTKVKKIVTRTVVTLIALCVVFAAVYGIGYTTGIIQRNVNAVTVGDHKVSSMEYNVYYKDALSNLINTMQQYGMDPTGIESQMYDETQTWGDVLKQNSVDQIKEIYILYSEAQANAYTMTEDDKQSLENYMTSFSEAAKTNDMDDEAFLKAIYGGGISMDEFKAMCERRFTATGYYNTKMASFEFTDADIENHYTANTDNFDAVSYHSFEFPYEKVTYTAPAEGETPEEGAPADEAEAQKITLENMDKANNLANEFRGKITDEKSFNELAKQYASEDDKEKYEAEDGSLIAKARISYGTGAVADWYKSADRKHGDITTIDTGSSIAVVYFVDRFRVEDSVIDVRHILINTETPAEDATEEQKAEIETKNAEAEKKASDLLDQWKSGAADEDSFAALAKENSQDPGSASAGGLYEAVTKGSMVAEFDSWIFDSTRKHGDSGIVKTSYGYHIMYYVGSNETWYTEAKKALVNEAYTAYYDEASAKYTVTTNELGMKL